MSGMPRAVITEKETDKFQKLEKEIDKFQKLEEEIDKFQKLRAKNMKYSEIAKELGCTVKRIDRISIKAMERTPPIVQRMIRKPWRIDDGV